MFPLLAKISQQSIISSGTLFFLFLMELFIINLITAGLQPKCDIIMGYNCSQDITPYLGHSQLDKHLLIMAFSGLRSDLSNTLRTLNGSQGQMSLQLVAEMHISPVNGDSVWEKKEEAYWSLPPSTRLPFLLSCTIISPLLTPPPTLSSHPAVTELPPASVISRLKNSPGFMLVAVKGGQQPALRVCVRSCRMILLIFLA